MGDGSKEPPLKSLMPLQPPGSVLKLYDWECAACGNVREGFVYVERGGMPPPGRWLICPKCDGETEHGRLISAPAQYLADKVMAPTVYGGKYDTCGYRKPPELPQSKDMWRWEDRERGGQVRRTKVASAEAMMENRLTPEWREAKRDRERVMLENEAKRKRSAELKKGIRADEVMPKPRRKVDKAEVM